MSRRAVRALAVALAVAALVGSLAGCSALIPNPWIGGWVLRSYGGTPASTAATLSFSSIDVVVATGCNRGVGEYTYKDGLLTLKDVAFTQRACSDPGYEAQDRAVRAIGTGPVKMSADNNQLTIEPGNGGAVLVFDRTSGA